MKSTSEERARWERENREAGRTGAPGGHHGIDRRVLELTRLAVGPGSTKIRRSFGSGWRTSSAGRARANTSRAAMPEWKALIEKQPWERLREMLLEESDEGQRLRSSHPFTGLVTEGERNAVHDATRATAPWRGGERSNSTGGTPGKRV